LSLPKDGLVVEYLKSEGLIRLPAVKRTLRDWKATAAPRHSAALVLIENDALSMDQYVRMIHGLEKRVVPCQKCAAPRYAPAELDRASPCRVCASADALPELGAEVGRELAFEQYLLEKILGQGAMGIVYEVTNQVSKRVEALKIMVPLSGKKSRVARFERESAIVAKLRHRNIVAVHRAGEHAGLRFIALEYVAGGTLSELIESRPPTDRICELMAQIADGLAAAHDAGVVHRDLKPDNILIDEEGRPKIGDFGLARDLVESQTLTRSGAAIGTPFYMPPEQLRGQRELVGPRSDVYALGVVLYEMLAGKPPCEAKTFPELYRKVSSGSYVSVDEHRDDVPSELRNLCERALEPVLERRLESAAAMRDALRWINNRSGPPPGALTPRTRRQYSRRGWAFAVILIALVSAALGWSIGREPSPVTGDRDAKRMGAVLARLRREGEQALAKADTSPAQVKDQVRALMGKLNRLKKRKPKLYAELDGRAVRATLARAEAQGLWLKGGAKSRADAISLLLRSPEDRGAALAAAQLLILGGQPRKALDTLEGSTPPDGRSLELRARAHAMLGNVEVALLDFERAASQGPLSQAALRVRIMALLASGRGPAALTILDKLLAQGSHPDIAALRAQALGKIRPKDAWRAFERLLRSRKKEPKVHLERARFLLSRAWPRAAREDLGLALVGCQDELTRRRIELAWADAEARDGRHEEAHTRLESILSLPLNWLPELKGSTPALSREARVALDRVRASALLQLAELDLARGKRAAARSRLEDAIAQDPLQTQALALLAQQAWRAQRREVARVFLQRAERVQGNGSRLLLIRGGIALEEGKAQVARGAFSRALARGTGLGDKADAQAGLARAERLAGHGRAEAEAFAAAAEADRRDPIKRRLARRLAQLQRRGSPKAEDISPILAAIALQRTRRRYPAALEALASRALLLQGKLAESHKSANLAVELNPQLGEAYLARARARLTGSNEGVLQDLRKALKLGGLRIEVLGLLGLVLADRKQHSAALQRVNSAIKDSAPTPALYLLRQRILSALGRSEEAALDALRAASYSAPIPGPEKERAEKAWRAADGPALKQIAWELPGHSEVLYDYGRVLAIQGGSRGALCESLLIVTHALYRLPALETRYFQSVNQMLRFGRRGAFSEAFQKFTDKAPRYQADLEFSAGAAELFFWMTDGRRDGDLVGALERFRRTLDLRADHRVCRAYLGLTLSLLGFTRSGEHELRKALRGKDQYDGAYFFLAAVLARRGERAAALAALARGRPGERLRLNPDFVHFFPDEFKRSDEFRQAIGLK